MCWEMYKQIIWTEINNFEYNNEDNVGATSSIMLTLTKINKLTFIVYCQKRIEQIDYES